MKTLFIRLSSLFSSINWKIFGVKLIAYTFSIFSVIFASQMAFELKSSLETKELVYLFVSFVIFFLIINEGIKINQCRKIKNNGNVLNIFILIFTFSLSLSLSGLGVYFMSNKTLKVNIDNSFNKDNSVNNINLKYASKLDSIQNLDYFSSTEYIYLSNQIKALKRGKKSIEKKAKIDSLSIQVNEGKKTFDNIKKDKLTEYNSAKNSELKLAETKYSNTNKENKKNNAVSYIFITLVIISEFMIFFINNKIGEMKKTNIIKNIMNIRKKEENHKEYLKTRKLLCYLYTVRSKGDDFSIKTLQYSIVTDSYLSNDVKSYGISVENELDIERYNIVKGAFDIIVNFQLAERNDSEEYKDKKEKHYILKYNKKQALRIFDKIYSLSL